MISYVSHGFSVLTSKIVFNWFHYSSLTSVQTAVTSEVEKVKSENQYTLRANLVFKNVFVPEKETVAQVEDNVRNIIW